MRALRRAWTALALLALAGCPQPIEGLPDAETPADGGGTEETRDGGHTDGGGADSGSDAGADAGTDAGADAGTDAGTSADAGTDAGTGPSPLVWGKMTLQSSGVMGIAGTARNNVYAAGTHGQIQHYDGSGWTEVARSPGNLDLRSVYVAPNGAVFAGGMSQLVSCKSGCTQSQSYVWKPAGEINGVCGADENTVYATGTGGSTSNAGRLYKFNPVTSGWDLVVPDTGSYFNTRCWVAPSGAVFIATQAAILRYENGTTYKETVHFPGNWNAATIANQIFEVVGGSGTTVFAGGPGRGIISRNALDGTWAYVQLPAGTNDYHALAGTAPEDLLLAGNRSGDGSYFLHFDGQSWTAPQSRPDLDVWALTAVDAKTWFAAGFTSGTVGSIWMGTRP